MYLLIHKNIILAANNAKPAILDFLDLSCAVQFVNNFMNMNMFLPMNLYTLNIFYLYVMQLFFVCSHAGTEEKCISFCCPWMKF